MRSFPARYGTPPGNFRLDCSPDLHVHLLGIWELFSDSPVSMTDLTFSICSPTKLNKRPEELSSPKVNTG